jgi:NNP family nitrate/nitrite transporter-like MFS transporter
MARSRISEWNPEDTATWARGNNAITRRNLFSPVVNVHGASSVWPLWSVMVLFMPYPVCSGRQLVWWFGRRTWMTISSSVLPMPTTDAIGVLAHPGLPLWPLVLCAALTGRGAGNHSSALTKADGLYPQRRRGFALGFTGGMANLGSATIHLVGLLVLVTVEHEAPYWVKARRPGYAV